MNDGYISNHIICRKCKKVGKMAHYTLFIVSVLQKCRTFAPENEINATTHI